MPTPVPLKILSRRDQRTRLIIAMVFAFVVGFVVHAVRPTPTTQVRYEVVGALLLLSGMFLWMLLGLRRIAYSRAWVVLVIEGTALWFSFAAGVLIVGRRDLAEVVVVTAICGEASVLLGLILLAVIQALRPPSRSLTCPTCEYDLRQSMSDTCTECGHEFTATCAVCKCTLEGLAGGACRECGSMFEPESVVIARRE